MEDVFRFLAIFWGVYLLGIKMTSHLLILEPSIHLHWWKHHTIDLNKTSIDLTFFGDSQTLMFILEPFQVSTMQP